MKNEKTMTLRVPDLNSSSKAPLEGIVFESCPCTACHATEAVQKRKSSSSIATSAAASSSTGKFSWVRVEMLRDVIRLESRTLSRPACLEASRPSPVDNSRAAAGT